MLKGKIIAIFLISMLVFTTGFGSTKIVFKDRQIDDQESASEEHYKDKLTFLTDGTSLHGNSIYSDQDSFYTLNSDSTKDQYYENGNEKYQFYQTSTHIAQGFKPTLKWLTKVNIYLSRTSYENGILLVLIRNNSVSSDDWLGAAVPLLHISKSGDWLELPCDKPYPLNPGGNYLIVLRLYTALPSDEYVAWWYGTGNPYSRGKAYETTDGGSSWSTKSDLDFNFQTWGTSTDPPNPPSNPYPVSGSTGKDLNVDLSWSCSDPNGDSLTYDVYFGTITPPPLVASSIGSSSYDPGELNYETTYYWKIVARDSHGVETEGPVWNFKTKDAPPGPPHITFIETYYADGSEASNGVGLFLQGMNLENTYIAFVSGKNVDEVEFTFGIQDYTDTNGEDGWTATFNTKNILNPFAKLQVRAHNDHGWSEYKTYTPRIIPMAGWLVNYITYMDENKNSSFVTFSIGEKDDPPKPKNNYWTLVAEVDFSTGSPGNEDESPVDASVPGGVPVDDIGGDYGYSGGVGSSVVFCSDAIITVSGHFEAEVTAASAGGKIGATLGGSIGIENNGIVWHSMNITITGEVTIPVFVIPLKICGVGLDAGITITPHVELTFQLEPAPDSSGGLVPGLGIKIKDNSGIRGNVGCTVRVYADFDVYVGGLYLEAGGDGTLYFKTPADNYGYFDDFVLKAWIKGKLRFLWWSVSGKISYSWNWPGYLLSNVEYMEDDWTPLDRDYINQNDYGKFVWDDGSDSGKVIKNAFPYASPCSAPFPNSAGNKQMIVWSHDNENKAAVKGMELWYTIWDQGSMTQPERIPGSDDDRLQMNPQVVFDKNGNAICIFSQTDSSIDASSDPMDAFNAAEIAYCVWDEQGWSQIETITDNNRMDIQPVLASNDNGDVVLVWTSDADCDHETIGDRSIFACFWRDNSWSEIIKVVDNMAVVSTPRVAIKQPDSAVCVFAVDKDGDPLTASDQEIVYKTITDGMLSLSDNVTDITDDSFQDASASVVYGTNGEPYVIWLKNNYHTESNQEVYDGTLYYQPIGGSMLAGEFDAHEITSGAVSDPAAFSSAGAMKYGGEFADVNFVVGWAAGESANTLKCATVKTNGEVDVGTIYGSNSKLSETDWCMAAASITAATVERAGLGNNGKDCNLSFVSVAGYDKTMPVTACSINGDIQGYGDHGPEFEGDVTIEFGASDEGGSGLYKTEYRLDDGAWETYTEADIKLVSNVGRHILLYRSIDKAGNMEDTKKERFRIITNHAPDKPSQPSGPTSGKPNVKYTYTSQTVDVDGDQIWYIWNWGDEISSWDGPYNSREIVTESHTWTNKGNYEIKVKAKDEYESESPWSDALTLKIDTSKSIDKLSFLNLLRILIKQFPVFERILIRLQIL